MKFNIIMLPYINSVNLDLTFRFNHRQKFNMATLEDKTIWEDGEVGIFTQFSLQQILFTFVF